MRYEAWEVKSEDLPSVVNRLRQPQNLGANITVPYKEAVISLIDQSADLAALVGAVNTVVNRDGRLIGFNTDGPGFIKALCKDAMFEPANKKVLILGAGGAARAVSFSLLEEKVRSLIIANRSLAKAENLAGALARQAANSQMKTEIAVVPLPGVELTKVVVQCQLIVNCTTVGTKHTADEGQSPLASSLIPRDALVYDLVYNPSQTPLLRMAKAAGARTIGGLSMLVYQGAASFELWTGREAPLDIMLSTARRALARTGG